MILEYNLQFFAKDGPGGEKTEPATSKKLTDARKDGQVAKSKELSNAFGLIALFLILKFTIENLGTNLLSMYGVVYNLMPELVVMTGGDLPRTSLYSLMGGTILRLLITLMPFFLIGVLVAFIGDYIQVKWKPTTKPLRPKMSKLNPIKGFKKIISIQSIAELIKSAFKIAIIAYVVYTTLKEEWDSIFLMYGISLNQGIGLVGDIAINLGLKISFIYLILALGDYAFQKWKFKKDMKMTKQEVKDEYKNAEGDPQIKGKIRQKMREASQRRMMRDIPTADVVITNPTHLAVAIRYKPETDEAPLVVAKGEDYLALKLKEAAKEYHIEIVENKPLARMLYANVDVGGLVPPELYQAVAEVLVMVYRMQGKV